MPRKRKPKSELDLAPQQILDYLAPASWFESPFSRTRVSTLMYGTSLLERMPGEPCTWKLLLETGMFPVPIKKIISKELSRHVKDWDADDHVIIRTEVQYGIDALLLKGYKNAALVLSNFNRAVMAGISDIDFVEHPQFYKDWIRVVDENTQWKRPVCFLTPRQYGAPGMLGLVSKCLTNAGHPGMARAWKREAVKTRDPQARIELAQKYVRLDVKTHA